MEQILQGRLVSICFSLHIFYIKMIYLLQVVTSFMHSTCASSIFLSVIPQAYMFVGSLMCISP